MTQTNIPGAPSEDSASLPAYARSAINRCNLPAIILGSLTFQQHPAQLSVDGVRTLHYRLFRELDEIDRSEERASHFGLYMHSAFLLGHGDEAGLDPHSGGVHRDKADYLRLLRGWMFNAEGIEAAVLKRWVESRFGLLTRNHRGRLDNPQGENYAAFQADYTRGIYNTNAIEMQIDLLYSYCQYELRRRWPERTHRTLYRGVNRLEEHDILRRESNGDCVLLLNNLSSFSSDRMQSDIFGDAILTARVPAAKLLYFPDLLPGLLRGEFEHLVIGGVYRISLGL